MERRNVLPAKVGFSLALILVASLMIACTSAAPAPAAKPVEKAAASQPITIKAYTAWSKDMMENVAFWKWVDELKARNSDVTINWIGGPEAIPPFESMEALRNGAVDLIHTAHDYNAAIVPAAFAPKLTPYSPKEERENGWNDLLNQAYEKGNAFHLGRGGAEMGFRFYTNVEIKSISDFKNLRIRVSPVYRPFVEALGSQPVMTAPGEVYTAMERKIVDGFGWPEARITDLGWHEVTKYVIDPPYYNTASTFLFNLNSWKKLSKAQQDVLVDAMKATENSLRPISLDVVEKEEKLLKDKGIKFITLADGDKYLELAYKASWDEVLAKAPDWGPKLKDLATKKPIKK